MASLSMRPLPTTAQCLGLRRILALKTTPRGLATAAAARTAVLDDHGAAVPSVAAAGLRQRKEAIRNAKPFSDFLTDSFKREHDYLRISVTERCNLRCLYCMPEGNMCD